VSHLDVKNAFFNGELREEVFIDGMVCCLHRSLYGHKQSPFVVSAAGFSLSTHNLVLFVHCFPCGRTLLLLYVDDMIITGDDPEFIAFIKTCLSEQFLMSDLDPLHYFLGIEVSSISHGFFISQ
jgi:hypothetical protein